MLQKERIIAKICEMIGKNAAYATEQDFYKGYCASLEEIKDFVAASDSDTSYNDLLMKVRSMYRNVVNPAFKHIISGYVPEVVAVDDNKIKNEIMVYLDWLDGKKECAPHGEYSIQQMVKYIRKNLNAAVEAEVQEKEKPIFEVGDVMRTKAEAAEDIRSGLPVVVSVDDTFYHCNNEMIAIANQHEYEYPPMNRVSQFNIGDYIVSNENPWCRGYITRIKGDTYIINKYTGIHKSSIKDYHLWSLKDVRDGDIIVSGQITLIFKKWEDDSEYNFVIAYAGVDVSGKVQVTDEHWLISNDAKPATEEQKEEFFKKLTECGYVWHPEIKTIVKESFDKKMYLSDNDSKMLDKTIWKLQDLINHTISSTYKDDIRKYIKWIRDFKERPVDDSKMFDKIIWKLIKYTTSSTFDYDIRENIKWLQDFKERISK